MMRFATFILAAISLLSVRAETGTADTNVVKNAAKPLLAQRTWETDGTLPPRAPVVKRLPQSDAAVLVRVNGRDITYGQLMRYSDFMVFLLKNRKPGISEEKVAQFRKRNLKKFSDALLQRTLIDSCLSKSNVVLLAAVGESKRKDFVRNFARRGQGFDDLKAMAANAGYARDFNDNFEFDVRLQSFVQSAYSNEYYVSNADFERTKRRLAAYNERAARTNDVTIAMAEDLLEKLRAGKISFADAADRYSQDSEKNAGGEIGDCDESDFPDDKSTWQRLLRLKDGGVTDLVETDDGFVIYCRLRKNTPEESQTGAESLKLSRIFLRRAYLFPDQTDEELRADIEREKRESLMGTLFQTFSKASSISYPEGKYDAK